jgi:2'-5' RNA ligase
VLFVAAAVPLTDASRGWLSAIATLAECRVVRGEGLHLTLRYLGPTELGDPAVLTSQLGDLIADERPFSVRMEGLGAFPNLWRPRTIWVGVTRGRAELVRLGRRLAPGEPGITPHCTVARVGRLISPASRERLRELADGGLRPLEFWCTSLAVMESLADPPGPARYRSLGELPLAGSASERPSPEGVE